MTRHYVLVAWDAALIDRNSTLDLSIHLSQAVV